ncbi:DUF2407 C-terminal domain-containing protein [Obelidium mucronatum]|nr:DUF2407 C-terminal domain-containing protein [Obelidium mucronatum]
MEKLNAFSLRQVPQAEDKTCRVVVRFGNQEDLSLALSPSKTVQHIKTKIIESKPNLSSKYLRLLHLGRILSDTTQVATLFEGVPSSSSTCQETNMSIYIHCAVSEAVSQEGSMDSNEPALGFDRLIDIGFSRQEVANLRTQFHSIRGRDEQHDVSRTAEEDWIDNRPRLDTETPIHESNMEVLIGLCCGFFGGILVLFWIKEHGLFTRRQQMCIIVGLAINLCFGLLRYWTS